MRKLLFAIACTFVFAAASEASASEEAPVDVGAVTADDWRDEGCTRRARTFGPRNGCRTAAFSFVRSCTYEIDVRASAIRFATGRRRHARIARCAPEMNNA